MSASDKPGGTRRTEPRLGDIQDLDSAPVRREPRASNKGTSPKADSAAGGDAGGGRRSHRGTWIALAGLLLIVLATLAWINQDRLRHLLPRTDLNNLLNRADVALQQGHLDGHDGNSARELYEAARALEPDNEHALDGLQNVGKAELERARKALAAGHADVADEALAEARSLLGGGSEVDQVAQQISRARQSQAKTDAMIEQARSAFAAGQLTGDDGAAALYRKALAADPGNAVARHGLDRVGDALAAKARKALQANDLDGAAATVDQIGAMLPEYGDLPSLRADVAHARRQADAAVQSHLDQAQDELRAGRFTGQGDDNALAQYRAVLAIDADNEKAKAGLGQVAQALLVQASAAMDGGDLDQAAQVIKQAAELAPRSADLAAAQSRLASLRQARRDNTPSPDLSPQQKAKLDALIKRGHAALKAGDLMAPPGACAYDLFRAALAIDGNNPQALDGLQALSGRANTLFAQALSNGNLQRAGAMLDTLSQLDPGDPAQNDLRHRLASAWMDRADKQLQDGDRSGAAKSLDAARRLQPEDPRLQQLSARLGQG
jgi:cellulose synthase operon protein C